MNAKKLLIVSIYGSTNNTKIAICDITGRIVYKSSGGMHCKQGRDKDSIKVASTMILKLNEFFELLKTSNLVIKVRNRGAGYPTNITSAVKVIINNLQKYYNIISVHKVSPFIHGYIRPKKPKRR